MAGAGRGGGGLGNSIGIGGAATYGRGKGGKGYGRGASRLGRKAQKLPKVFAGKPIVSGSLDKKIVQRIMRRAKRKFLYCYNRELQKRQDLSGKVGVKFVIGPSGKVISARINNDGKVTTIKNAKVERCIVRQVKRLKFPSPKGGGIVRVNYGWRFDAK